jgi:phenylacetate 2-hydroxylase
MYRNLVGRRQIVGGEIHGTCISLLQAPPETVASGVYQTIAGLCTPSGQPTQAKVVEAILEAYGGDRDLAWKMAFREEKVPLLISLYKETLRLYTFAPFATPRRTVKDIQYKDVFLPKGITMIMNALQVNHDPAFFGSDAMEFNPARLWEMTALFLMLRSVLGAAPILWLGSLNGWRGSRVRHERESEA